MGRLVLSGRMTKLAPSSPEETAAKAALFKKHPSFKTYPSDHNWYVAKMDVDSIWLIDFYGGPAIISPADYFNKSDSKFRDGPPAGPRDKALCPVTGASINITVDTPTVKFINGQKLYFSS